MITGMNKPTKPTGEAGVVKVSRGIFGAKAKVQKLEFPTTKVEIETFVVNAFLPGATKCGLLPEGTTAQQNKEQDLDFTLTFLDGDSRELELTYILDEVHKLFPSKLNHIRYLFGKARERLEELLPAFTKNRIVVRSLYLQRDDWVREAYDNGLHQIYGFMYPQAGAAEGFFEVGKSFMESDFYPRALEAFQFAEDEIGSVATPGARLKRIQKSLRNKMAKLLELGHSGSRSATEAEDVKQEGDQQLESEGT